MSLSALPASAALGTRCGAMSRIPVILTSSSRKPVPRTELLMIRSLAAVSQPSTSIVGSVSAIPLAWASARA